MAFITQLRHSLARLSGEFEPFTGTILVAVSGGADSVALLVGLKQLLVEHPGISLRACHINHLLRTEASHDAKWVTDFVERLGMPIDVDTVDVRAAAAATKAGIEEAARDVRYESLTRHAAASGCRFVAVAHHFDDNVETVLHRVVRGTGLGGLRGIPPIRQLADGITLIRPLLDIARTDILKFLQQEKIPWLEDQSNSDSAFTRNRIRNQLLPLLERDYNPRVRQALQRLAVQATDIDDLIRHQVQAALESTCSFVSDNEVHICCEPLRRLPRTIVRSLLLRIWNEQNWPRKKMGFDEWDSLAELVLRQSGGRDLPGRVNAAKRKGILILRGGAND